MRTIHREVTGGFIFSSDNKLLLGKSRKGGVYKGCWIVPGGGVDEGETELQGLRREILEETGLDVNSGKVEKLDLEFSGQSEKTLKDTNERVIVDMNFYDFVIKFERKSRDIIVKTEDDFIDAHWFSTSELASLKLSPPTTQALIHMGLLK